MRSVQDSLADIFTSLSIVLDKPLVPGDFEVDDEHLGTIEYLGSKPTQSRNLPVRRFILSSGKSFSRRGSPVKRPSRNRE